jgi:hypothetical protein
MLVEINPDLERRLHEAARERSLTVSELVEQVLQNYLDEGTDDPLTWVRATQERLVRVWPAEDFSDWHPPHGQ